MSDDRDLQRGRLSTRMSTKKQQLSFGKQFLYPTRSNPFQPFGRTLRGLLRDGQRGRLSACTNTKKLSFGKQFGGGELNPAK